MEILFPHCWFGPKTNAEPHTKFYNTFCREMRTQMLRRGGGGEKGWRAVWGEVSLHGFTVLAGQQKPVYFQFKRDWFSINEVGSFSNFEASGFCALYFCYTVAVSLWATALMEPCSFWPSQVTQ